MKGEKVFFKCFNCGNVTGMDNHPFEHVLKAPGASGDVLTLSVTVSARKPGNEYHKKELVCGHCLEELLIKGVSQANY